LRHSVCRQSAGALRHHGKAIVPFFMANWLDSNPGSALPILQCRYLYWGLPALFAIGWAIGRRSARTAAGAHAELTASAVPP
jgi:hypothetical protein